MKNSQQIVIIRHAKNREDAITEEGRVAAVSKGKDIAQSIFDGVNPNWIVLFNWTSLRVQQTMVAIKEWMWLALEYPVHILPLEGYYREVGQYEISSSWIIIRRVIAWVGSGIRGILIVTNRQYIEGLAENLWKYWWLSQVESLQSRWVDESLDHLKQAHWRQELTQDVSREILETMWDNFGKVISLSVIASKLNKELEYSPRDLKDYMDQSAWYFAKKYLYRDCLQEITWNNLDPQHIITFNPEIEERDDEIFVIIPTREEFIAEITRAYSYLWRLDSTFINPVQWLNYKISHQMDLFE